MTTILPTCLTCRFRHTLTRQCRRFPPQAAGLAQAQGLAGPQMTVVFAQAEVADDFWCGEYMPAGATPAGSPLLLS